MDPLFAEKHALLLAHSEQHTDGATLLMAILRTAELIDRACSEQLAQFDLTESRFAALLAAAQQPEASPAQLAEQLDVSRAAITGLVDGLVRRGLVTRRAHATDRRSLTISITPAGQQTLEALRPRYGEWLSELAHGVDAHQASFALSTLGTIQQNLSAGSRA